METTTTLMITTTTKMTTTTTTTTTTTATRLTKEPFYFLAFVQYFSGRDGASTGRAASSHPSSAGGVTFVDGDDAGGRDAGDDGASTSTSVTERDGVNHVLQVDFTLKDELKSKKKDINVLRQWLLKP